MYNTPTISFLLPFPNNTRIDPEIKIYYTGAHEKHTNTIKCRIRLYKIHESQFQGYRNSKETSNSISHI